MHDKTTVRDAKDGSTTIKKSLYNFPKAIHQKVLDMSGGDVTVGSIYSEAIRKFREEYELNKHLNGTWIIKPERKTGVNVQVWLTKEANEDLNYLTDQFHSKNVYVIYSAVLFYLQ